MILMNLDLYELVKDEARSDYMNTLCDQEDVPAPDCKVPEDILQALMAEIYINPDRITDLWSYEQENGAEYFEELKAKYPKLNTSYWYIEGKNMGWRKRTGTKWGIASRLDDMLRMVTPDCEYTAKVELNEETQELTARVSHHDSPTGETYTFFPKTEEEYNKEFAD